MRRIIALTNLVDGDKNYRPGDVIEGGQLEAQADYYAGLGQLRIEALPSGLSIEGEPEPATEPAKKPSVWSYQAEDRVIPRVEAQVPADVNTTRYQAVSPDELQAVDYTTMTVAELRAEAQARGIPRYATMRKDELLEALSGVRGRS